MPVYNTNCDGAYCAADDAPVRRLPTCDGAALILCRACYEQEMVWRRERNQELQLTGDNAYALPAWATRAPYPE